MEHAVLALVDRPELARAELLGAGDAVDGDAVAGSFRFEFWR